MKLHKKLLLVAIILTVLGIGLVIYTPNESSVAFSKQNVPFFVLKSSEADVLSTSFISELAVSSGKESKDVFLLRQDTQEIVRFNEKGKSERVSSVLPSTRAIKINSQGNILVADNLALNVSDSKGNRINNILIPALDSFAALGNDEIVLVAPDSERLLTVVDISGKEKRKMGNLKQLDKNNNAQNRFLNLGKVSVSSTGEIYYTSMFSPIPSVQKFSKQGELLKEFAIEGAAVDLQLKRAKEFLNDKKISCTGGYYIVRAAAVDTVTEHLWIGLNGSSQNREIRAESGVLYEYNPEGEKIAEYGLTKATANGEADVITDVKDIAVKFPYAYVLTSQGSVYRFNLEQRLRTFPKSIERKGDFLTSSIRASWELFSSPVSAQASCPSATNFTCEHPCQTGYTPTIADCDDDLRSRLGNSEIIISTSCQTGTSVGNNGGCSGSVTACNTSTGARPTFSVTINCEPIPTPTPTPEPTPTPNCTNACDFQIEGCEGYYDPAYCGPSPVLIDIAGNGFGLTDANNGVGFDINGDGQLDQISWTAANSDDSWLALDRNGNNVIENGFELFGNFTPQPQPPTGSWRNGFLALAEYDKLINGGNNNNQIDAGDAVFSQLKLWNDANHNGISEANELQSLAASPIRMIELNYRESRRTDEYGNRFKYRAKVKDARGEQVGRWAWDVFLLKIRN